MNPKPRLLDHPFYQAWSHGAISQDQLARYAVAYAEFIGQMPAYWTRIGQSFGTDTSKIVTEETVHEVLWEKWSARLPQPVDYPRMTEVLDAFANFGPAELLGAVQAFEIQQPEVARTKKAGLISHYGFTDGDTLYFDKHFDEEEHIAFGRDLAATQANADEFRSGFQRGADLIYHSLDLFVTPSPGITCR